MGHPEPCDDAAFAIRDLGRGDFDAVLRLNDEWEHVTSPLAEADLAQLYAQVALHRVAVDEESSVVAFLLALAPGTDYASPNYRWFDSRYDEFLYIDRVVVSASAQRAGLGGALYADAFAYARANGIPRIVCEVDIEPPNAPSDAFHRRCGFVEVGTQRVAGGKKRVSLRECPLG